MKKIKFLLSIIFAALIIFLTVHEAYNQIKYMIEEIMVEKENSEYLKYQAEEYEKNIRNAELLKLEQENTQKDIIEYINKICNVLIEIPEFNEINKADKEWIYAHLEPKEDIYYSSKEQIEKDLKQLFGPKLIIDVEKDTNLEDSMLVPRYDEEKGKYEFIPFGFESYMQYAINSIDIKNYVVNVIEYKMEPDMTLDPPGKEYSVVATKGNISKEIFRIESNELEEEHNYKNPSKLVNSEVINKKEKFKSYNIKLEKTEDGLFYVKKVERL